MTQLSTIQDLSNLIVFSTIFFMFLIFGILEYKTNKKDNKIKSFF